MKSKPWSSNQLPVPADPDGVAALVARLAASLQLAPMRPFQLPSLGHFDMAVSAAIESATRVEALSPKTCEAYTTAYRSFRRFLIEEHREKDWLGGELAKQCEVLNAWIGWVRTRGCSRTTVNDYYRAFHAVVHRVAKSLGAPAPTRMVPTPRPGQAHPRFLTRDTLERLFTAVRLHPWRGGAFERARNLALLGAMGLAGLRLSEVLHLKVADVSLPEGTIRVRAGKGRDGGKDRMVYLAPVLRQLLAEYLPLRREKTSPYFFLSTQGDGPLGEKAIRRLCTRLFRVTQISFAPHVLRHTAATLMRQAGIPDRLAMQQLGHASLSMLQRYSHVVNGELAREIERVVIDA